MEPCLKIEVFSLPSIEQHYTELSVHNMEEEFRCPWVTYIKSHVLFLTFC